MINSVKRNCLVCGSGLQGRIDKKFCSDQCRSVYNNGVREHSRRHMRQVNYILRRNYRILSRLHEGGSELIDPGTLLNQGFDFHYFTSLYPSPDGLKYFCYEIGLMRNHGQEAFRIIVKND